LAETFLAPFFSKDLVMLNAQLEQVMPST